MVGRLQARQVARYAQAAVHAGEPASKSDCSNEPSGAKENQDTFLQAPLLELLIGEVLEDQLASGIEGSFPLEKLWAIAL